jgi:cell division inhibitor SulA
MFQTLSTPFSATRPQRQHNTANPFNYFAQRTGQQWQDVLNTLAKEARRTDSQEGWLLLIAPPFAISKQLLEQAGVASSRVLVLHPHTTPKLDMLVRDALTCSTCKAVVTFVEDEQHLTDYQYLANKYQTRLVNHTAAMKTTH